MKPTGLKNLALCAALALSPAVLFAQAMPADTTSPSNSNQATKPADTSSDSMAYQKELAACDKQPTADQEACRNKVDQKHNKKSSTNTPPASSGKSTY